ncbi:MFS transporter [Natronospora cellulosivora (SeqCode)]
MIKIKFKTFYLFYYMYIAAITYLNLYLNQIGISNTQLGSMISISRGLAIFILPLWGILADYFGANKKVLLITLIGTLIFIISFLSTEIFILVFIIYVCYNLFQTPIMSLSDALLLGHLKEKSALYGRYRVWGSIGYMLGVTPFGFIIENTQTRILFFLAAIVLLLTFISATKLPEANRSLKVSSLADFKILLKNKELLFFLVFVFLIEAPLAANFIFFPIFFAEQGGGETLLGLAMFLAAASELIVFQKSDVFFDKFKLKTILLISSLAFTLRWLLIAAFPVPSILMLSQLLHSLTFALFHVTAVNFISRIAGEEFRATGQNLYASTLSIATVVSSVLGGMIYDQLGGASMYFIGSILSLITGLAYYYKLNKDQKEISQGVNV